MFERRLKALVVALLICVTGILARLFQLQIVQGRVYQEQAAKQWVLKPKYLAFLRGEIQDRNGEVLARDEASFDVGIHYKMLAEDRAWIKYRAYRLRRQLRRQGLTEPTQDEAEAMVRQRIDELFQTLAEVTEVPLDELDRRRREIIEWVQYVKKKVQQANEDLLGDIREERMWHPIIRGLSPEQEQAVRIELGRLDWLSEPYRGHPRRWAGIDPSRTRVIHHGPAVAHFIGRLRTIRWQSPETKLKVDNELDRYVVGERVGYTGVERLCERQLRGRKGYRRIDHAGALLGQQEPVPGRNVRLTIDIELQEFIYGLMDQAVKANAVSPGGAVVILDVPTRQILALVSYPTYDPQRIRYRRYYRMLAEDAKREPLRFRAVAAIYPPGSTLKPLVALKALTDGVITAETHLTCSGSLFPDKPGFRCFHGISHGLIDVADAIKRSCNVFFYQVGGKVGFGPLRNWLHDEFGLGECPGTGLIEEAPGKLATVQAVRRAYHGDLYPSESWLLGVGQGRIAITPLQSANMVATIAAGQWMPPTLVRNETRARPARRLRADPAALQLVRDAMRRVVNEPGGTAYHALEEVRLGGLKVAGKTGSAEDGPKVIRWRIWWTDRNGRRQSQIVHAADRNRFIRELRRKYPHLAGQTDRRVLGYKAYEVYPPPRPKGLRPSHAWFTCYAPFERPKLAMSVVLEYGGTGGRVAAPLANAILMWIRDHRPHYLFGPSERPS